MFHNYPYTDFHELNLDWFLKRFKELEDEWNNISVSLRQWLEEKLQQWLDDGTIADYLNNIYIVDDYIGPDDEDDTAGIQRCITQHPNSIIMFKGNKTYEISDTINLYGNQGGQLVIFGGAYIKWTGETDYNKIMIDVNTNIGEESRCHIFGGTFNGNDRVGYGIRSVQFHTIIDGCKVMNVSKAGYTIGYDYSSDISNVRSLQNTIRDCNFLISTDSIIGRSDRNTVRGIELFASDNTISGCNIIDAQKGIYWKSAGHTVSDTHLTARYSAPGAAIAETYAIYLDPYSQTSINSEILDTVYFDNHKYCIYAATPTRKTFNVNNSKYFWSGRQATGIVDTYMTGGYFVNVKVNNFTVVPVGGKCRFYDASICHDMAFQARAMLQQDYNKTIYTLLDDAFVPYTANHLCNDNETIEVYRNTPLAAGEYIMIGCLLVHETSSDLARTPSARFKLYNRIYGDYDFTVHWSEAGVPSLAALNIYTPSTGLHFVIGAYQSITLAGTEYQYIPLYLTGETAGDYGLIEMYTETGTNVGVYLLNDKEFVTTDVTPALDINLGAERQIFRNPNTYKVNDPNLLLGTANARLVIGAEPESNIISIRPTTDSSRQINIGRNNRGINLLYLGPTTETIDYNNLIALNGRRLAAGDTLNGYMPERSNSAIITITRVSSNTLIKCYADISNTTSVIIEGDLPEGLTINRNSRNITIVNNTAVAYIVTGLGVAPTA